METNYHDISELDEYAMRMSASWRKSENFILVFAQDFIAVKQKFTSGQYGPEWNFVRWLALKVHLSERQVYRRLDMMRKCMAADDRERLAKLEEEEKEAKRKIAAEKIAAKVAAKIANYNIKIDKKASQAAWDEWQAEEKKKERARKRRRQGAKRTATSRARKKSQPKGITKKPSNNNGLQGVTQNPEKPTDIDVSKPPLTYCQCPECGSIHVIQNVMSTPTELENNKLEAVH